MIRSQRRREPAAPAGDPAFQALKALVIERTGHHYYADKDEQLWERVVGRMAACGLSDPAAYLDRLAAGEGEWRLLESAVTINETFFFRFAEQFDVLRRTLLPRLLREGEPEKRLRIWSVGCSTGAEPYSLAIILHDLLGEGLADWRVSITGTDIDEAALQTACSGRYSSWALRTLGGPERERLFDREGAAYRLKARYRGLVRFEHHNMMTLLDPAAPLGFNGYDLILCRNVLIYFRHDVAARMAGALAERLAPRGHLLVGHAEAGPELARFAAPDEVNGVLTYRRLDAAPERPAASVVTVAPPLGLRRPAAPPRRVPPRRHVFRSSPPASAPDATLDEVRAALASGDAAAAVRMAEREVGATPREPAAHYLTALGALAVGEEARAEQGFRRALYLDTGFAMAHYLLGRHLLATGRVEEGRRALANAARAAASLDPEAELKEGDGMTAGALAAAVRVSLS